MQSRTTVIRPRRSRIVKTPRYVYSKPIFRYHKKASIYINKSTFNQERKNLSPKSLYVGARLNERKIATRPTYSMPKYAGYYTSHDTHLEYRHAPLHPVACVTPLHSSEKEVPTKPLNHIQGIMKQLTKPVHAGVKKLSKLSKRIIAPIKKIWEQFTNSITYKILTKIIDKINPIWEKRHRFSYSLYTIVFTILTAFEVIFIQWGMYSEPDYKVGEEVDETTKILESVAGKTTKFVSQLWLEQQYQVLLNFIILGVLYLTLIFILNRFWVSTAIFGSIMTVYAVANHIKMETRNEPILPADLSFITGGNTGELTSFIPKSSQTLVSNATVGVIWLIVICIIMQFVDRRRTFIYCSWKHPFANIKNIVGTSTRILAAILSIALVFSFTWGFGNNDYWSTNFAKSLSDSPQIWNGLADSTNNGPIVNFLRLAHTKTMDKPAGYSKQAMEEISEKYADVAQQINSDRTENLTDSTVIMLLSETFSDPTRVPGVSFDKDPIPYVRQLKTETTSGLMLSPGYGGGTANIEYQALTGLSMANYSSTLSVAYQQLVPSLKWAYTFNQAWNDANGEDSSIAIHAYNRNMYFRDLNYKKFGFSKFYATDGKPKLTNLQPIDSAWYASDESLYDQILKQIGSDDTNMFYQVVTMQNHMPYSDFYENNQFKDLDTSQGLQDTEKTNIETYAKGLSYTDQATQEFLSKLNEIDRPITVIFYGDHLPGIYPTASSDPQNTLGLHETDYFIWSNNASSSAQNKLDDNSSAYTSSNYFTAQLASHMNAKVSPYLAFLTQMHQAVSAISVPASGSGSTDEPVYLDASGDRMDETDLSEEAKTLLQEYKLIQYDMTIGKRYLKETGFVDLP